MSALAPSSYKLILDFLNKEVQEENKQLQQFYDLIGSLYENVFPNVPFIKEDVVSMLKSNPSLDFSLGVDLFTMTFEITKPLLSKQHIPPPSPFVLTNLANLEPSKEEVSLHISNLLFNSAFKDLKL